MGYPILRYPVLPRLHLTTINNAKQYTTIGPYTTVALIAIHYARAVLTVPCVTSKVMGRRRYDGGDSGCERKENGLPEGQQIYSVPKTTLERRVKNENKLIGGIDKGLGRYKPCLSK